MLLTVARTSPRAAPGTGRSRSRDREQPGPRSTVIEGASKAGSVTNKTTPKASADCAEATTLMSHTRPVGHGRAMSRCAAGLALIALGLGGCATQPPPPPPAPPKVDYLAPSGVAPAARSAVIQQPPELLLGAIVDQLQQGPFTITEVDEEAGFVVARYSGDPEPYIDCGWIVTYDAGELERIPAATAGASFDRMIERDPARLNRQLRLDGRMVVSLTPRGAGTVVGTSTTYVLTKMIDMAGPDGSRRGQAYETISFGTGESGTFAKGTRCQPNGRFERVVLDSLPATTFAAQSVPPATVAAREEPAPPAALAAPEAPERPAPPAAPVAPPAATTPAPTLEADTGGAGQAPAATPAPAPEPVDAATVEARLAAATDGMPCGATVDAELGAGNSVRLSGYVDSEQDAARLRQALAGLAGVGTVETALEVQPWPFCAILQVIDPYRNPDRQRGLVITTPDRETLLSAGDPLTLDIFLPPDAEYLYLGYVQTDGRVGYITVLPVRQYVQDTGAIRFETGYEISPPFGREMIVAITSERPLFDQALPAYQPPEEYVAMLRERLAAVRANDRDAALDASHLVLRTQPRPAF